MGGKDGGDEIALSALRQMLGNIWITTQVQISSVSLLIANWTGTLGWVYLRLRVFPLIRMQGPIPEWKCWHAADETAARTLCRAGRGGKAETWLTRTSSSSIGWIWSVRSAQMSLWLKISGKPSFLPLTELWISLLPPHFRCLDPLNSLCFWAAKAFVFLLPFQISIVSLAAAAQCCHEEWSQLLWPCSTRKLALC